MSHHRRVLMLGGLGMLGLLATTVAQDEVPVPFPEGRVADRPAGGSASIAEQPATIQVINDRFSAGEPNLSLTVDGHDQTDESPTGVQLGGDIEDAGAHAPRSDGFLRRRGSYADRVGRMAEESGSDLTDAQSEHDPFSPQTRFATNTEATRGRGRDRWEEGDLRTTATSLETYIKDAPLPRESIRANHSVDNTTKPLASVAADRDQQHEHNDDQREASQNVSEVAGDDQISATTSLPLWTTLLFASLGANLYFCWIARSVHTKYQDLVADISESDTRTERRERRLRRDSRSSDSLDDVEFSRTVKA